MSKVKHTQPEPTSNPLYLREKWQLLAIFLLGFAIYANTLTHDYTQDDAIVIYDNMFTTEGISGIPGILTNDTFYGFFKEEGKKNLVTGGRYRPITQIMFAVEWQLFGKAPWVGHLINILLYCLLGVVLYKLLLLMFSEGHKISDNLRWFVFIICVIYIAHPVHTEAVANIKGRDEILTMLGAIVAMYASFKYYYSKNIKWQIFAAASFFVALMSKENAITFLAVVPLAYMLFKKETLGKILKLLAPFALSSLLFLVIRFAILGADFGSQSMELMNNPFLKIDGNQWVAFSGGEKWATIITTLGMYIGLLAFPYSLCHDYYPRAIEVMQIGDLPAILSMLLYLVMAGLAFFLYKKDKYISFGIMFFIITLSIVSNIVFPIGTLMSERFLFMPSLGFAIIVGRLLSHYVNKKLALGLVGIIILAYSIRTITRNMVWKNDFTLFTTDVKNQPNSAKLLNAAGGALSTEGGKLKDSPEKTKMLKQSIIYLQRAIEIHPTYQNAHLLLANANYYLGNYDPAVATLDKVLKLYPNYEAALTNLPIILRDAGRHYGEKENNLKKSEQALKRSYDLSPGDLETNRLLGIISGMQNQHERAIFYFEKVAKMAPNSAANYVNLGTAYQNAGDKEKALEYYNKAVEIDPKALNQFSPK